ncbi:MAG: hypothetical protein H6709_10920 [Kofleriaceae bacterium]|nr:hypothetical protein [Myxococcales bacterium]MCB9572587.1 hypothetical protein [Kofleriaceae bacterium]
MSSPLRKDHTLLRGLATHFPGSRLRLGAAPVLDLELDGSRIELGMVTEPSLELVVSTIPVDGFRLELQPMPRAIRLTPLVRTAARASVVDAAGTTLTADDFVVISNDAALARLWLDVEARGTLPLALHLDVDDAAEPPRATVTGCPITIVDRFVRLQIDLGTDLGNIARAIRAGAALASRPLRLARAWRTLTTPLGGVPTAGCWDLGDQFAVVFQRGATTVELDNVRRLPGEDDAAARLRTRLRARQHAVSHDYEVRRVAVDAGDQALDEFHVRAPDPALITRRLHALAPLVRASGLDVVAASRGEVTLTWAGMLLDPARIVAGVDLVARLAADRDAAVGPYR